MMASKSSPHLHGFWVTSKVARLTTRSATPYWRAARMIPGTFSVIGALDTMLAEDMGERNTSTTHLASVDI